MSKKSNTKFVPYANESDVLSIEGLSIENRVDRIELKGGVSITKDKAGLVKAKQLKELFEHIVQTLEQEELPEAIEVTKDTEVPNPLLG